VLTWCWGSQENGLLLAQTAHCFVQEVYFSSIPCLLCCSQLLLGFLYLCLHTVYLLLHCLHLTVTLQQNILYPLQHMGAQAAENSDGQQNEGSLKLESKVKA